MSPYEESQRLQNGSPLPPAQAPAPEPFTSPRALHVPLVLGGGHVPEGHPGEEEIWFPQRWSPPSRDCGSSREAAHGSLWAQHQCGSVPHSAAPSCCCPPRFPLLAGSADVQMCQGQAVQMCQGTGSSCCCVPATSHQLTPTAPRTGALADKTPRGCRDGTRSSRGASGIETTYFLCAVTSHGPHSLHRARGDMHAPPPQESLAESPGLETHPARSAAAFCSGARGSALLSTPPGRLSSHGLCPRQEAAFPQGGDARLSEVCLILLWEMTKPLQSFF